MAQELHQINALASGGDLYLQVLTDTVLEIPVSQGDSFRCLYHEGERILVESRSGDTGYLPASFCKMLIKSPLPIHLIPPTFQLTNTHKILRKLSDVLELTESLQGDTGDDDSQIMTTLDEDEYEDEENSGNDEEESLADSEQKQEHKFDFLKEDNSSSPSINRRKLSNSSSRRASTGSSGMIRKGSTTSSSGDFVRKRSLGSPLPSHEQSKSGERRRKTMDLSQRLDKVCAYLLNQDVQLTTTDNEHEDREHEDSSGVSSVGMDSPPPSRPPLVHVTGIPDDVPGWTDHVTERSDYTVGHSIAVCEVGRPHIIDQDSPQTQDHTCEPVSINRDGVIKQHVFEKQFDDSPTEAWPDDKQTAKVPVDHWPDNASPVISPPTLPINIPANRQRRHSVTGACQRPPPESPKLFSRHSSIDSGEATILDPNADPILFLDSSYENSYAHKRTPSLYDDNNDHEIVNALAHAFQRNRSSSLPLTGAAYQQTVDFQARYAAASPAPSSRPPSSTTSSRTSPAPGRRSGAQMVPTAPNVRQPGLRKWGSSNDVFDVVSGQPVTKREDLPPMIQPVTHIYRADGSQTIVDDVKNAFPLQQQALSARRQSIGHAPAWGTPQAIPYGFPPDQPPVSVRRKQSRSLENMNAVHQGHVEGSTMRELSMVDLASMNTNRRVPEQGQKMRRSSVTSSASDSAMRRAMSGHVEVDRKYSSHEELTLTVPSATVSQQLLEGASPKQGRRNRRSSVTSCQSESRITTTATIDRGLFSQQNHRRSSSQEKLASTRPSTGDGSSRRRARSVSLTVTQC